MKEEARSQYDSWSSSYSNATQPLTSLLVVEEFDASCARVVIAFADSTKLFKLYYLKN